MKIDEKKIRREYKKLLGKYYGQYYNPLDDYFNDCGWCAILSDRSRGKTTNVLLLGMLLNKEYGILPHYIRRREQDVTNMNLKDLFKTIRECDENYIEKLTDGKYNDVTYSARRWYYCRSDENGIVDKAPEHFMMVMSIDKADGYKSTYNAPKGDFIIEDEFIPLRSSLYLPDQFVSLLDIIKTVFRDRTQGCKIFCLSNVISKYSPYFNEWGCSKEVQKLKAGEHFIHTTVIGTKVMVKFMNESMDTKRQLVNSKFFGFDNPKLGMLNNAQWQLKMYPHPLFRVRDTELIDKNIFIKHAEQLLQLELRIDDTVGLFIVVHNSTADLDKLQYKIVYSLETFFDKNYHYGLGSRPVDRKIWSLYTQNKFYYSDNDVGALLEDFVQNSLKRIK